MGKIKSIIIHTICIKVANMSSVYDSPLCVISYFFKQEAVVVELCPQICHWHFSEAETFPTLHVFNDLITGNTEELIGLVELRALFL